MYVPPNSCRGGEGGFLGDVKYFSMGQVCFSVSFTYCSEARVGEIGGVRGVWRGRYLFTVIGVGTLDLSDAEGCFETAAIAAAEARPSDLFEYGD